MDMRLMELQFRIKKKNAIRFFRDVMDSNSRKYIEYVQNPESGLVELYHIAKDRLLDELENNLQKGITHKTLYDGLFSFCRSTIPYEFNSMYLELTTIFLETIMDFEKEKNILINKEPLYFLRTTIQITSSNTIGAMADWELAAQEQARITGVPVNTTDLINKLPQNTILNHVNSSYSQNSFIRDVKTKYPELFKADFKTVASGLSIIDAISFLSCGLKNVQAINLIKAYGNKLHLNRIFAQEIVNSLCVICESTIKDYMEVISSIPNKKERQLGKMLNVALGSINPGLSSILGSSTGNYSGMYKTLSGIMSDTTFNTAFPVYISDFFSKVYSENEFKARVLVGIHSLRNKVLHDIDDTLCYYNDAELFVKTVGLLFAGVTVTQNLK